VAGKHGIIGAVAFVLPIVALVCAACGGQRAVTPTATPAAIAVSAVPVNTTPAAVLPTAAPSPTPSPAPPATLQSVRLPAGTIALYGLGKEQSLDLYALGADGSVTGLGVQVDRGWLVSGDGRWAVHLDTPGAAARAVQVDNLETGHTHTIPLGQAGCMAGLWAFDREGTRLASVEVGTDYWALVVVDLRDGSIRRFELARAQGEAYPLLPGQPLGWAATGELLLDTFYPFSEGGYAGVWALTLPDGASPASVADLGRQQLLATGAYLFRPQLSPDGARLLYLAREPGYTPAGYTLTGGFEDVMANQLWSLDLASGQAAKLVEVTDGGALAWAVAWSPDGREALFAQGRYVDGQRLTALALQAVDAAGTVREIGALPAESQLMGLRWCQPGLALAILYPGGAASELYTVDLAGGRTTFVGKGQQVSVLGTLAAGAGEEALPSPTPAASAGMLPLLSLHMVDERNGWALANWALLHTTDGGRQWADVTPPDSGGVFSPVFLDANRAWAAFSRQGNPVVTLCHTADGGRTWETNTFAQTFSSTVMGLDLDAADLTSGWLVVIPLHGMNSSPAALFRTGDGGAHWTQVASTNDALPYGGGIRCAGSTMGWLSGVTENTRPLSLSVTRDGGQSWQAVELPLPLGYEDGRLSVGLPTFFGVGQEDALLRAQYQPQSGQAESACIIYASHDGGRSWQATMPVRNGSASDFFSATEGWIWAAEPHNTGSAAPVQGTLYHTRDGAQTWEALPGTPGLDAFLLHGGDVLHLDFVSAEAGWAIVCAADGRTTQLAETQDGGRHWGLVDAQMAR